MATCNRLIGSCCLFLMSIAFCFPVVAEDRVPTDKDGKKYPHPHSVHMSIMEQNLPEFTRDDVSDWREFVQEMRAASADLPLREEARILIASVSPTELSASDQIAIINELNAILANWLAAAQSDGMTEQELKWQLRSRLIDLLPSLMTRQPGSELTKITCVTCHETQVRQAENYLGQHNLTNVNEQAVLDCLAAALAEDKGYEECRSLAEMLKKARIEPYGPLRNYLQKEKKETDISFFVAVHPEDPYTFHPLLRELVCIECHGVERNVHEIKGRDGTTKKVPIFYGLGAGNHDHEKDHLQQ